MEPWVKAPLTEVSTNRALDMGEGATCALCRAGALLCFPNASFLPTWGEGHTWVTYPSGCCWTGYRPENVRQ